MNYLRLWVVDDYHIAENFLVQAVDLQDCQFERPGSCQLRCDIESGSGTAKSRDYRHGILKLHIHCLARQLYL